MSSLANITGLPLWQTLLVNSVVDITSFCTSVVARMAQGNLIHGRNLDFDFPAVLQQLTYRAFLKVNEQIVGEAICHAGYIGVYTAVRYQAFSVSYNVRMLDHKNTSEITANIEREWADGVIPAAQAIQNALLFNRTFSRAVEYLSTQPVNTPCYIILSGVHSSDHNYSEENDRGVTLTRDPYSLNHTDWLLPSQHRLSATRLERAGTAAVGTNERERTKNHDQETSWFIVQTNADWWRVEDTRYETTVKYLAAVGPMQIDASSLVTQVLNMTGVVQFNTVWTASMCAAFQPVDAPVSHGIDVYFTPVV